MLTGKEWKVHINNQHKSLITASSNSLLSLTSQLTATASSRAAFMQCLRWGIWCPFQESNDWNGEEIQLRLHGGPESNPHAVMVYSTQTSAKPQYSLLSTPEVAQVMLPHTKSVCSRKQMWIGTFPLQELQSNKLQEYLQGDPPPGWMLKLAPQKPVVYSRLAKCRARIPRQKRSISSLLLFIASAAIFLLVFYEDHDTIPAVCLIFISTDTACTGKTP